MGLVAPVRRTIHASGGEGSKAQLVLAGGDVLGNLLQVIKALDVLGLVASLLQQGLVGDQTVALDNVADAQGGVAVLQGVGVAGQLTGEGSTGQVVAVVFPAGKTDRTVDLEQGGCVALGHLAHQGGLVLTGSSGHNGDGNAGLLGVLGSQILPCFILLGLEVQVVDLAGCISSSSGRGGVSSGCGAVSCGRSSCGRSAAATACQQAEGHGGGQAQRKGLFCIHGRFPP